MIIPTQIISARKEYNIGGRGQKMRYVLVTDIGEMTIDQFAGAISITPETCRKRAGAHKSVDPGNHGFTSPKMFGPLRQDGVKKEYVRKKDMLNTRTPNDFTVWKRAEKQKETDVKIRLAERDRQYNALRLVALEKGGLRTSIY